MTLRMSYPLCQCCSQRMRIVRRGVRVDDRGYFEQQKFICPKCSHSIDRRVTTDGSLREGLSTDANVRSDHATVQNARKELQHDVAVDAPRVGLDGKTRRLLQYEVETQVGRHSPADQA